MNFTSKWGNTNVPNTMIQCLQKSQRTTYGIYAWIHSAHMYKVMLTQKRPFLRIEGISLRKRIRPIFKLNLIMVIHSVSAMM